MRKVREVVFLTESGGEQFMELTSLNQKDDIIFWDSVADEAIDGSLRSSVKAYRRTFYLEYDIYHDNGTARSILNNIIDDIDKGFKWFYFGIDTDSAFRVTLDDANAIRTKIRNQIAYGVPDFKLIAYDVSGVSLRVRDYRFIDEAPSVFLDYGLITEEAEEFEDFGEII